MMSSWRVVHDCLAAVAYGAILPDWEFGTVMGFTKAEARDALADWSEPPKPQSRAVARMAMVNILGYPHGLGDKLQSVTGWSLPDVEQAWRICFGDRDVGI